MSGTVMTVLDSGLRHDLEDACVRGRRASEGACRAALGSLGVSRDRPRPHLDGEERALRRGLRAKARQLGDVGSSIDLLVGECAFEQWHRVLFARFLAENDLLIHPDFKAPVTLIECHELAVELSEPDGWGVAARFASEILPGIFRLGDPCAQLRLAPEGRLELERIVAGLPTDVFTADDALGWVYQFWQRDKKDEINASERKIGGADLGPVTQLFTDNYMVRFLLENSLGAWWASRHPDSALVREWDYLRFSDDGLPAAGSFEQWPDRVAEVTVMDPCCGSGHFLVEAFSMLWRMRMEEEGWSPTAAQNAVLRDNLFGLELDPRCVEIAMFAVALQAWKAGGGWRELPVPHIACSGIPVKAPIDEWKQIACGDQRLENALMRLHILFRDADTLGSLIDPEQAVEVTDATTPQSSFEDVDWDEIAPLLARALSHEANDPATAVLGTDATGIARAAGYLSRRYTLITTNPPFLGRVKQSDVLRNFIQATYTEGRQDLAAAFLQRLPSMGEPFACTAVVTPQNWCIQPAYEDLRRVMLNKVRLGLAAVLGEEAFESFGIRGPRVSLLILETDSGQLGGDWFTYSVDASTPPGSKQILLPAKSQILQDRALCLTKRSAFLASAGTRIIFGLSESKPTLREQAESFQGLKTGDDPRLRRYFWELPIVVEPWLLAQGGSHSGGNGLHYAVEWGLDGRLIARSQGQAAWGRRGAAVSRTRSLSVSPYLGVPFLSEIAAIVPRRAADLEALWTFASSGELERRVRQIDTATILSNGTFLDVPCNLDDYAFDNEMTSSESPFTIGMIDDDPTQWLFEGRPEVAMEPLQVAVARLLGYRWPDQVESDDLDTLADDDGIACLPAVLGERAAADRLRELLARAFGVTWSPIRSGELLSASASKKNNLESWLRDDFFKTHCKLFKHRPFVWHIWDGRSDGFGALVNCHGLDRAMLQRLTFTYLGDWIERQIAGVHDEAPGAEERLTAAQDLQGRLRLILEGEPPYDIYVRWRRLAEQPIGWEPDVNDGVRLNVRPFVKAEVLRSKFNVKWSKDRGRDPNGSERHNDLHYTRAEKEAARGRPQR